MRPGKACTLVYNEFMQLRQRRFVYKLSRRGQKSGVWMFLADWFPRK